METLQRVRFNGALDISNLAETKKALSTIDGPCELDLYGVSFLDSTAITAFVECARRIGPRKVHVRGATFQFRRILELVGLTHLFDIVDDAPPGLRAAPELHTERGETGARRGRNR
jgi:anti-anti-sigma factor